MPDVTATETTGKAAMLKGVIEMEVRVAAALIMSNPLAVVVNVRGFGVALLVSVMILLGWCLASTTGMGSRSVSGYEAAADLTASTAMLLSAATTMLVAMLRERK